MTFRNLLSDLVGDCVVWVRRGRRRWVGGDGRVRGRGLGCGLARAGQLPAEELAHLRQVAGDAVLLPGQVVDLTLGRGARGVRRPP